MFAKIENLRQSLDVASTENIADTLQHIGVDLSSKEDHVMAIKWLKRADKLINAQDLERLSIDGRELRLAIFQGLIQAYLGVASSESIQLASDLASYVESEVGDKPVVLHWRLEILQKSPGEVFDAETYSSILRRMIRTFDFSEGTFHFLLHHIKELRDKNPKLACGVLDELLKQRVLLSGKTEWISKTVIRRIWMGTMEVISDDAVTGLKTVLDLIWDTISEHLGSDAAGAAHSVCLTSTLATLMLTGTAHMETSGGIDREKTIPDRREMVLNCLAPALFKLWRSKPGEIRKETNNMCLGPQ